MTARSVGSAETKGRKQTSIEDDRMLPPEVEAKFSMTEQNLAKGEIECGRSTFGEGTKTSLFWAGRMKEPRAPFRGYQKNTLILAG